MIITDFEMSFFQRKNIFLLSQKNGNIIIIWDVGTHTYNTFLILKYFGFQPSKKTQLINNFTLT